MTGLRRRSLFAAAWSVPVVVVSAAAPAYAASGLLIELVGIGVGGNGYDLYLADRKFDAVPAVSTGAVNYYRNTTKLVTLPIRITYGGVPVIGATVTVSWAGNVTDIEGNTMLKIVPANQPTNVPEGIVSNSATTTSSTTGIATVAVGSATYQATDTVPKSGTFTVTVSATGSSPAGSAIFTWQIF